MFHFDDSEKRELLKRIRRERIRPSEEAIAVFIRALEAAVERYKLEASRPPRISEKEIDDQLLGLKERITGLEDALDAMSQYSGRGRLGFYILNAIGWPEDGSTLSGNPNEELALAIKASLRSWDVAVDNFFDELQGRMQTLKNAIEAAHEDMDFEKPWTHRKTRPRLALAYEVALAFQRDLSIKPTTTQCICIDDMPDEGLFTSVLRIVFRVVGYEPKYPNKLVRKVIRWVNTDPTEKYEAIEKIEGDEF